MRIIGKTNDGYICTLEEIEIVRIMGFDSIYSEDYKKALKDAGVNSVYGGGYTLQGATLDVAKIANKVDWIRSRERESKRAIETLRGLADALETAWPSLEIPKPATE